MPSTPSLAAPSPSDARRAAFRTRDAVRAAFSRAGVAPGGGVEVSVAEPEAAMPIDGLARAIAEAARDGSARLVPGGGWAGAPFPERELYVASWALELLARRRAAAPAATAPAVGAAPATVRGREGHGPATAFSPWLAHSFAGRKAHARPDVLSLVPSSARTVLDVGCGEGALGASLEARGARVTGVELDVAAADVAARRLSRVVALPAEEAVASLDARPDVVLLADVLEHLSDPCGVLRALRGSLAPGGILVFSVPNATHSSVLGGMLRGRWDRELEGIVADDHRTYAGRAGWTSLLSAVGFRVTSLLPAAARTALSDPDRSALLASTALGPDDLDAVQWLGTAEPAVAAGIDVPAAEKDEGPLGGENPVDAVAGRVAAGETVFAVRNAVHAAVVGTLLAGGLVAGRDAAGLVSGWTPSSLVRRFEGSGLGPRVEAAGPEALPAAVRAAVAAYRAAGLPADEETLLAAGLRATFGPER
ncbi:MAG: class I SAM-dependent methyltransferase [Thermoanaerobaculia bacterium]